MNLVVSDRAQPVSSGLQVECQCRLNYGTTLVGGHGMFTSRAATVRNEECRSASGGNDERSEQDSDSFKTNSSSACEPSIRDGEGFRMRSLRWGEPVTLGATGRNNSKALSEAGTVEDSDGDRGHSWSPVRCKEDQGDFATQSASTLTRVFKIHSSYPLKSQESPSSTASTTHAEHLPLQSLRLDGPAQGGRSVVPPAMRNTSRDASSERESPCARGTCLVLGSCICGQPGKFKPLKGNKSETDQSCLRCKSHETGIEQLCVGSTDCCVKECR